MSDFVALGRETGTTCIARVLVLDLLVALIVMFA